MEELSRILAPSYMFPSSMTILYFWYSMILLQLCLLVCYAELMVIKWYGVVEEILFLHLLLANRLFVLLILEVLA